MSDGSIFSVYRTIDGHSAYNYSRDDGATWEPPQYMRYANGRLMKHPRAANFAWRCENGKYLYWFHNHGGRFIREHPRRRTIAYEDRNPVWLAGGVEADSPRGKIIRWSQPEIVLYDDDPIVRMSYPDLVENGGDSTQLDSGWAGAAGQPHTGREKGFLLQTGAKSSVEIVMNDGRTENRWASDAAS